MKTHTNSFIGGTRAHGLVLALSLFFMLLVTVIGLFLFRSSTLELRMAGNASAKATSFENAETARLDAESTVLAVADDISAGIDYDCIELGAGHYALAGSGSNCEVFDAYLMSWDSTDSLVDTANNDARYVMVYMGEDEIFETNNDVEVGTGQLQAVEVHVFQVLGRGDEDSGALTIVESTYLARSS